MMEAFWTRMQVELLDRHRWRNVSSWPTRSLSTLRFSTTVSAVIAASAWWRQ